MRISVMGDITASEYNKLLKKGLRRCKALAQITFNEYIRIRDSKNGIAACISCGKHMTLGTCGYHCGHFYSVGEFDGLRFVEDNAHAQCLRCNHFKSGNLLNYRDGLIKKIGLLRFNEIQKKVIFSKKDILFYISIILKYREKIKLEKGKNNEQNNKN